VLSDNPILVIDDEPAIRALVARILVRAGYDVDTARDGLDAIRLLSERTYSVALVDLMMPGVNGFAVIDFISELAERPTIIVVTAGDSAAYRQLDGHIVHSVLRKPFDIDVLVELVGAAARLEDREEEEEGAAHDVSAPEITPSAASE
jgi:two-component system response regulator VanR